MVVRALIGDVAPRLEAAKARLEQLGPKPKEDAPEESADVARDRAHKLVRPEAHVIVLFGATGDLARRKLIPGLFHLGQAGLLPHEYRIVGTTLTRPPS